MNKGKNRDRERTLCVRSLISYLFYILYLLYSLSSLFSIFSILYLLSSLFSLLSCSLFNLKKYTDFFQKFSENQEAYCQYAFRTPLFQYVKTVIKLVFIGIFQHFNAVKFTIFCKLKSVLGINIQIEKFKMQFLLVTLCKTI